MKIYLTLGLLFSLGFLPILGYITQSTTPTSLTPPAIEISYETAVEIALQEFPNAAVYGVERYTERNIPIWDIKLSNGINFDIDRRNGTIIDIEGSGSNWDNDPGQPSNATPTTPAVAQLNDEISLEEAIQIVLVQFPEAVVYEIERDDVDGLLIWEIELSNGATVDIDQRNGAIVSIKEKHRGSD